MNFFTHFPRLAIYQLILRPIRKAWWLSIRALSYGHKRSGIQYHRYARLVQRKFFDFELKYGTFEDDQLTLGYFPKLKALTANFPAQPKFSVLIPVYKVPPDLFAETLVSVSSQVYENWEACIVDDASGDPRIAQVVEAFAKRHPGKVKFAVNEKNSHISITSNKCLELATGDYVALLDHDDRLTPNALAEMTRFINMHQGPDVLYSDERVVDATGNAPWLPFLKPDWSPFLHLSVNYTTHLTVYGTAFIRQVGGFRKGYEGSQDHDLMLRAVEATKKPVIHVPFVLYQWRAIEGSTASGSDAKPYAATAGIKAVSEACVRRGIPADVEWEKETSHYRLKFHLPKDPPLISIIIPNRDAAAILKACVDSIFAKSTYRNFEILIVDNGSTAEDALSYMKEMQAKHPSQVRVLRDDGPFNFGALNNRAAREAKGEYLLLLNNDTEVLSADWLEEMLRCAQLPQVAAVGCKLLYPDRSIQHAGILLIDRRIACHALRTLPENTYAYIAMGQTLHDASGVTAACLMIAKKKYFEVGGLDDVYLPNGFGDVDLCLKLRGKGYVNLYTPYATLIHHESKTRGKNVEAFEKVVMLERWAKELMTDPYLHFQMLRSEHYQASAEEFVLDPSSYVLNAHWLRAKDDPKSLLPGATPAQ